MLRHGENVAHCVTCANLRHFHRQSCVTMRHKHGASFLEVTILLLDLSTSEPVSNVHAVVLPSAQWAHNLNLVSQKILLWITHANLRHFISQTCDTEWRKLGVSSLYSPDGTGT